MKTLAVLVFSVLVHAAPLQKPNVSAEFSKKALKALLALRDGSETAANDIENAEVAASTPTDNKVIEALHVYGLRVAMLSQADAMIEQMKPGACFAGIKAQLQSRIWKGLPDECNAKSK